MLTVHPSIVLGSYLWDEERLPRDEFDIRMSAIRETMAHRGWSATIVYGDAREHAALAFFSNFIPRMRWAMALFPAEGEPLLLASMSSRDMPAMRTMTWLPQVKSGWEWRWFDEWVTQLQGSGKIGTIGFDLMTPLLFGSVSKSLANRFELEEGDDVLEQARRVHRPRELALMREAVATVHVSSQALHAAWQNGVDLERASLAGERAARSAAAQDVRTLVSRDGWGSLEPYAARFEDRPKNLFAYLAVKHLGYWAETFICHGAPAHLRAACHASLEALMAGLRPGATLSSLALAAQAKLGGRDLHPVLTGRFGRRIGLSLDEGASIRIDATGVVEENVVYALHVGAMEGDAAYVASALVVLRHGHCDILDRSGS